MFAFRANVVLCFLPFFWLQFVDSGHKAVHRDWYWLEILQICFDQDYGANDTIYGFMPLKMSILNSDPSFNCHTMFIFPSVP